MQQQQRRVAAAAAATAAAAAAAALLHAINCSKQPKRPSSVLRRCRSFSLSITPDTHTHKVTQPACDGFCDTDFYCCKCVASDTHNARFACARMLVLCWIFDIN